MKAYWQMIRRLFDVSFNTMLIYRANVVFFLIFETMFIASQFLAISVGFDFAGNDVAGWTRQEAYALTAINYLSHHVFLCFFISQIFNIGPSVWNGQFDYVLLKPLHPLTSIFYSNGQFMVSNIPNAIISFCLVIFLLAQQATITPMLALAFAVFFLTGVLVRIALALACMAPVFFTEKLGDVVDTFWSISGLARYPTAVFPRFLSMIFTFILPIGMVASIPSSLVFAKTSALPLLGSLLGSWVFIWAAKKFFMYALRHYQSVNSGM